MNLRFITDLKTELPNILRNVNKKVTIITGYVTVEGFEFIEDLIDSKCTDKIILFKLDLNDFKNGASSFNFKKAVDSGWKVYINKTIHAKNYIFDDEIVIIGSSNLSSNGIGLCHNRRDDNCVLYNYSDEHKVWVEDKINSSILIDSEKAENIDKFIQKTMFETNPHKINALQSKLIVKLSKEYIFTPSRDINSSDVPILENMISGFVNAFKASPDNFATVIENSDLYNNYKYNENVEWYNNYIIDINQKLTQQTFNYNNILYKYTPKIYRFNNVYYLEKIYGIPLNLNDKASVDLLLLALKDMFSIGIATDCKIEKVLYYKTSIKIPKFYPVKDSDKYELELLYKNSLLVNCRNEEIKKVVENFRLGEE